MNMYDILAVLGATAGAAAITNTIRNTLKRTATEPAAEPAAGPAATANTANGAAITTIAASRFLTMFEVAAQALPNGKTLPPWRFASRRSDPATLPAVTHDYKPDAVAIQAIWQDPATQKVYLVLIKQYRATVDDYVIELPAGLVEAGEFAMKGALRETFEETGLTLIPNEYGKVYMGFSSIGMTDECIGIVNGTCEGTPSSTHQEADEDIEVILADVDMCEQFLANAENHPCDIRALFAMQLFINEHSEP